MKTPQIGFVVVALVALLSGCSGGSEDSGGSASATPMALQGTVHGGQAPIVGSAVTLHAVSSGSMTVATATTDSNGNFSFNFNCPSPTAQMYVTSTGGNSGSGSNSAIHLMSLLGPCQTMPGSATVNELTTVAAAYVANAFIGPSGCDDCGSSGSSLPANVDNIHGPTPGLPNAFGNAPLLVSSVTGLDAPTLPSSADCPSSGSAPANCLTLRKLNTAANALAACVNSSGPSSAQCVQLFDCATAGAVFTSSTACAPPAGTALPTDTLVAMLNIVRNPAKVNANGIDDTSNRDVVFSPAFASPNHFKDYTLSLNLTAGGINGPVNLAADGAGNIWITSQNSNSVIELSPNGVPLSGASGFAVGSEPQGIAFDTNGNAWVSDAPASTLTVLDSYGYQTLGSPISGGGISQPEGIAISPDGDVWVSDYDINNLVSRFTATGSPVGSGYGTGNGPVGVAVDASGYVFVTNVDGNSVTELDPSGNLVKTITDGSLDGPWGAAIDTNGNCWVANLSNSSLTRITLANDSEVSAANFTGGGLHEPNSIAIDAAGDVWVGNEGSNAVSEFNSAGTALSPSSGFVGAGLENYDGEITPAVDGSGNVWFASYGNSSVTVFFGAAAPTRTPLIAAITQGFVP